MSVSQSHVWHLSNNIQIQTTYYREHCCGVAVMLQFCLFCRSLRYLNKFIYPVIESMPQPVDASQSQYSLVLYCAIGPAVSQKHYTHCIFLNCSGIRNKFTCINLHEGAMRHKVTILETSNARHFFYKNIREM